jgi:hypothetical protein
MFPKDSHSLALQYKPEQQTVEFFPWYQSIKTRQNTNADR